MINLKQAQQINHLADCGALIKESQDKGASISITLNVNEEIIDALDSMGVQYSVNVAEASETISE